MIGLQGNISLLLSAHLPRKNPTTLQTGTKMVKDDTYHIEPPLEVKFDEDRVLLEVELFEATTSFVERKTLVVCPYSYILSAPHLPTQFNPQ